MTRTAGRRPRRMLPGSLAWARERIRRAGYLRKWVLLGALIGIVAGLGALVFIWALGTGTHLILGLAGYAPPSPAGEGAAAVTSIARPWLLPLIVGGGGLLAGFIIFRWAPEAEGHGTDAAIDAFHHDPRGVRTRIPLIKLVASAITIGSGGSGGREGPTAQISAGFGSLLGRVLDLDARDARIAVAVGIGSGIGAIFRAPLGGAVLGAEILYRDDIESDALLPSFIASIVGYSIFAAVAGFSPLFGEQARADFSQPLQLGYYAGLGIVAGLVGALYVASFYGLTDWFRSWQIPRTLRPAIAGVAVGLIGIALPGALGTGYGWLQQGFLDATLVAMPLWVVLLLPFAKILTTSLSIGSGGSGGVFGPGMVIGGLLGAGIWRLLEPIAPGLPSSPAPFVIVGMMATFGSVAHAPLAVMLMVAEMTGNLGMLAPAMVAVGLATLVAGDRTIYRSQLPNRIASPAHRFESAMPVMASLAVSDTARAPRCVLRATQTAEQGLARLRRANVPGAPVIGSGRVLIGSVSEAELEAADPASRIDALLGGEVVSLRARDTLDVALAELSRRHAAWLPVTREGRLVGVVSMGDLVQDYRRALSGNVRRLGSVRGGAALLEAVLTEQSPLVGRTPRTAAWPKGAVVVAVQRGRDLLEPGDQLKLQPGDHVSVLVSPAAREAVNALLGMPQGTEPGSTPGSGTGASGPAAGGRPSRHATSPEPGQRQNAGAAGAPGTDR
jgi:CIC family chloride channel protein